MNDELDGADGTHIDRRSLLKKAGAAGALGLAMPISFDSFFSPAAACSGVDVGVTALTTWTVTANGSGGGSSLASPSVTTVNGSLVLVAFNLFWNPLLNTPPSSVTVSGSAINTVAQLSAQTYQASGGDTYRLYVFTARGTGATSAITVNVSASTILGTFFRVDNFAGQVLELTSNPQPGTPTGPDTAQGTGATATVVLAPAPPVDNTSGQLLVVAGHPNNVSTGDWSVPAAFPGSAEVADTFSDNGGTDVSLASFYDPIANTGNVSSTFSGSAAITGAATWAAMTVEITC